MQGIWGMKRNRRLVAWMFIGGMTNEHIRTGLPRAFFVMWFPSGPQWKQHCSVSNTHMLPDASESQKTRTWCTSSLGLSSPLHPIPLYGMLTKHADRQSKSRQPGLCYCIWRLTSAPDKLSWPCPLQLLRVRTGLSVCKLCNWHIDICIHTLHTAVPLFFPIIPALTSSCGYS